MKLTVGLDALTPPLTGIGYYTLNLLREYQKHPDLELHGISYRGWWSQEQIEGYLQREALSLTPTALGNRQVPWWHRVRVVARDLPAAYHAAKWWRNRKCGQLLSQRSPHEIYHEPNFVGYPFPSQTTITVHDLSHIRYPEAHPPSRVAYLNRHLPRAVRQASAIIAVSHSTKREMLELGLETDPARIHVTHLGHEPGFHPRSEEETHACRERFGLAWRGYVLSVATLEPRKNLERLLAAYLALPASLARDYPLVLAGGGGWKGSGLQRMIANVKPPHRVVVTGYLRRPEVQALMASAVLFAYPSLYEGFGLPVLEAMASGTPVLTADNTSLGEVAGEAALTVPPSEIEAIEQGLLLLLESDASRDRLRGLGLQRAKDFSWERCAERTMQVYRMLERGVSKRCHGG